jgi:ATP-dependent DNA helicase RecQ
LTNPLQILKHYWGYSSFKPMQEEIITSVLNGQDTVALLPTGGGKSVCFQIPALAMEGICIVVSPLIALMTDQVNALQKKGIKALAIVGGLSQQEVSILLDNAMYGNYKFLYISPERLRQEIVQNCIRKMNVNLIAVDEAHCISKWGKDFRPAYKEVHVLNELHPLVSKIALTATATQEVLTDTISQLKLELPVIYRSSFTRSNLSYQVLKEDDKLYRVQQLLKNNTGAAIIYVRSRKKTVETCNQLNQLGFKSTFYHGGIDPEEKKSRLASWINGSIPVMVATNAFGMGIDNPNVRFVIHIQLPESLESYFQEAGRAGRDSNMAYAYIVYNEYDKILIKKQFIDSQPSLTELKTFYRTLNSYFQISYGEGEFTEHSFDYNQFCKVYKFNSIKVYNGLNTLDRLGILQLSKQFGRKSIVKFLIPSEKIISYFENDVLCSIVGKTILRLYGGIFEIPTPLNLDLIASKTNQSITVILEQLKKMERDNVIDLKLHITDATITFLVPREDDKTINAISKEVNSLLQKKEMEVGSVLDYLENNKVCKSIQLVRYFDEKNAEPCGICSVCANQIKTTSKKESSIISKEILLLLENSEMSSREITERLIFTENKIVHVLQQLQDINKIKINTKNQYYIL